MKRFKDFVKFFENSDYWIYDGSWAIKDHDVTNGKLNKKVPDEVTGKFECTGMGLTTLEGCHTKTGMGFYCEKNKLTSLKGGPKEVGLNFNCQFNELTTLEGGPISVNGTYFCFNNKLTDLKGIAQNVVEIDCSHNLYLTSLEGCPKEIKFDFLFNNCSNLETLYGAPKCDKISSNKGTKVPYAEWIWFHEEGHLGYTNYYLDLLKFIIKNDKLNIVDTIKWPKDFYSQELVDSIKGINKFNL